MKTIFRLTNLALLMAALLAFGAVAGFAQDPCQDADGQTKMQDEFDKLYAVKPADATYLDSRQQAINSGKTFLEKYGSCESTKDRSEWLKKNLPGMEQRLAAAKAGKEKDAVIKRFNDALAAKNWDDLYTVSKELMTKWPDDFNGLELVLGSIGYDELLDRQNAKYSDQTLQYAKQSLADLQANKTFKPGYGVAPFVYKGKDDAIAWMNITIGSIYYVGKKDKQAALPYLFKATQAPATSDVSKNPNPYEFIGRYYFDELNKVVEQIQAKAKDQNATDPVDVAQKKVDEIKALVAMSNGLAERAMDAFSRAYTIGTKPDYKARMKKNIADAYKLRFNKDEGVDTWIAQTVTKPFADPTSPVQPISDPEPVKTGEATTAAPGGTKPTGAPTPGTTKPAGTTTTTTGTTKPAGPIKPGNRPTR